MNHLHLCPFSTLTCYVPCFGSFEICPRAQPRFAQDGNWKKGLCAAKVAASESNRSDVGGFGGVLGTGSWLLSISRWSAWSNNNYAYKLYQKRISMIMYVCAFAKVPHLIRHSVDQNDQSQICEACAAATLYFYAEMQTQIMGRSWNGLKWITIWITLDSSWFFKVARQLCVCLAARQTAYWRCIDANARVQKLNITYVYLCYFTCLAGNHLCPWSTLLRLAPRCDVLPRFANRVLQGFAQEHTSPVDASWHLPQREREKKGRDVQRK